MISMQDLRVAVIGTSGTVGSLLLERVNALVGIGVGLVTFAYVAAKTYYLIKDHQESRRNEDGD